MLGRFLEEIRIAGISLGKEYQAYRMDGTAPKPDMRKEAGLGMCDCCDYFTTQGDTVILIEETELVRRYQHYYSQEYVAIPESKRADFVYEKIREKNRLKVYGSLLVLCRLAARYRLAPRSLQAKKYTFLLVISDMDRNQDKVVADHLQAKLRNDLGGLLRGNLIDDLQVGPPNLIKSKLSNLPGDNPP